MCARAAGKHFICEHSLSFDYRARCVCKGEDVPSALRGRGCLRPLGSWGGFGGPVSLGFLSNSDDMLSDACGDACAAVLRQEI